jgi:dihydrofolate reductase
MNIKAIACKAKNDVIGCNGTLPWKMPKDMLFFKKTTMGHTLLVGRKTWESFPKALPGRKTIIWTSKSVPNMPTIQTLDQLKTEPVQGDLWVCGGYDVYKTTMPLWSELILTELKMPFTGDVYFPPIVGLAPVEVLYEDQDMKIRRYLPTST